jgi:hypothetical protein
MTPTRKKWTSRLAAAFGLWLVVCVVAQLLGNQPRPGLVALVIGAAAGTLWLYLDTSAESEPPRWGLVSDDPIRPRGSDARLSLFERVVSQHLDARDVTDQLHRYLSDITERRLVATHGISRVADPGKAAELLGPELAGFLDHPRARRMSLQEIDRLLTRIEAL